MELSVSHLMYVDDILLSTKANPKSLKSVKTILETFSGLMISSQKSSIIFSKVCENLLELPSP